MSEGLIFLLVVAAILIGIVALARWHDRTTIGDWQTHAVCKCGWWMKPAFGDSFFIRPEVCPKCAEPMSKSRMAVRRWNGPMDDWEEKA